MDSAGSGGALVVRVAVSGGGVRRADRAADGGHGSILTDRADTLRVIDSTRSLEETVSRALDYLELNARQAMARRTRFVVSSRHTDATHR